MAANRRHWRAIVATFAFAALAHVSAQAEAPPFNPYKIKNVYYLLVSPQGSGESSWGHALLRFSEHREPSVLDKVVDFYADTSLKSFGSVLRALGVGPAFPRVVSVKSYEQEIKEMNYTYGRSLTSYQVVLTPDQKWRLVNEVNNLVKQGRFGDYSFLSENCAAATKEIFDSAGVPLPISLAGVIPTRIPSLLRDAHVLGKIYVDHSVQTRRKTLFASYEKSLAEYLPNIGILQYDLTSHDPNTRILGFARILTAFHGLKLPTVFRSYLSAFRYLEPVAVRSQLAHTLSRRNLISYPLPTAELNLRRFRVKLESAVHLKKQEVVYRNGQFELVYEFHYKPPSGFPKGNPPFSTKIRVPLPQLKVTKGGWLLWHGTLVGLVGTSKISRSQVILDGLKFVPRMEATKQWLVWSIVSFAVLQPRLHAINQAATVAAKNFIPFANDPNMQACGAMVDLQIALLEHVAFDPNERPLSNAANIQLVKALLAGKIVIVPGFDSQQSWLSSIPESQLKKTLFDYNNDKYTGFFTGIGLMLNSSVLTTYDIARIGELAEVGIYTPVFQHLHGAEGHAYLILKVVNDGQWFRLVVYDPNFGPLILHRTLYFSKATQRVESALANGPGGSKLRLYPTAKLKALPSKLNRDVEARDSLNSPLLKTLLLYSKIAHVHDFSSSQLLRIY